LASVVPDDTALRIAGISYKLRNGGYALAMTDETPPTFGSQWWEHHYAEGTTGPGAPNPQMVVELSGLSTGTALDAGCGEGAGAIWLARQGWEVTAIDISPTAVANAESFAAHLEPDVARRVSWVVADLTAWEPPKQYDLVISQYVHPTIAFGEYVRRLTTAVAPKGTLLVVGHDPADSHSGRHAPQDASISIDAVVRSLDERVWEVDVAEARQRTTKHGSTEVVIHDLVVRARRRHDETAIHP
jgi:SAM-dependent methyltransferase